MHVVKLFDSLLSGIDVEIVEAALPKTPSRFTLQSSPKFQLIRIPPPPDLARRPRDTLFQDAHHRRRCPDLRLRNQQVNMLRHHHVAHKIEFVARAHFVQDHEE